MERLRAARIRAIAVREWREAAASRSFVVVSVLLPALMLGLTVLPMYLAGSDAAPTSPSDTLLANQYVLGLLLVLLLFLGVAAQSQALLRSVMEERGTRMMELLLSSITPLEMLVGKLLGYAAVALTQLVLWVVTGVVLVAAFHLTSAIQLIRSAGVTTGVLFLCCYAVGYLLYASIYAAVGAVIAAEREAHLYQQLLGLMLMIPFVASAALISNPGSALVARLTWIPLLTPTLLLLRWAFGAVTPFEIVGTLLVTLLAAFAALMLAARVFRGAALLSARRLSWREAWRAGVRQSYGSESTMSSKRSHSL
ncbi:MAG TPA: ABC transporter permease [Gemmatimonadaceae bacterium]|nr:ABC transporter permease [Gemmatimonadaceae bacterium]